MSYLWDVLAVAGAALLLGGVWLVYPPAALIIGGAGLVAVAWRGAAVFSPPTPAEAPPDQSGRPT